MRLIIDQVLIPVGGRRAQAQRPARRGRDRLLLRAPRAHGPACRHACPLPPPPPPPRAAPGSGACLLPGRENVETVVSVENKQDAVMSNGHEGRYLTSAADFRSRESHHAYENTLEPEERVITTAM
ncbi:PDZK1-interacting protein 1 isoform X1 [Tyto alba]|uniref:PDZK1-interacting protein 1 isoform X1 n=1 Tax=Tyto alba TaxID=56313 RepID=UPI001402B454|nr:PDZK1-interacting protein 1 isoform X1 [Tyto alba]